MPISMRCRPMLPSFGRPYASTSGNARHFVGAPGRTWASVSGRVDAEWPCNLPCVGLHTQSSWPSTRNHVTAHQGTWTFCGRALDVLWACLGCVVGIHGRDVGTSGCKWTSCGRVSCTHARSRGRLPWTCVIACGHVQECGLTSGYVFLFSVLKRQKEEFRRNSKKGEKDFLRFICEYEKVALPLCQISVEFRCKGSNTEFMKGFHTATFTQCAIYEQVYVSDTAHARVEQNRVITLFDIRSCSTSTRYTCI